MEAAAIRWGVGLAFFGVAASAGVGAATVSGYERVAPWLWYVAAFCFIAGGVTLGWPWVSRRIGPRRRERIGTVAAHLRSYSDELDRLYEQARNDPSESDITRLERAARRTDEFLVPWKVRVLEYLDGAISREAAMQVYQLGSALERAAPGAHAKSSHEVHRSFLDRLAAEVEAGEVNVKHPPGRSGTVLPMVKSFVYRPEA